MLYFCLRTWWKSSKEIFPRVCQLFFKRVKLIGDFVVVTIEHFAIVIRGSFLSHLWYIDLYWLIRLERTFGNNRIITYKGRRLFNCTIRTQHIVLLFAFEALLLHHDHAPVAELETFRAQHGELQLMALWAPLNERVVTCGQVGGLCLHRFYLQSLQQLRSQPLQ